MAAYPGTKKAEIDELLLQDFIALGHAARHDPQHRIRELMDAVILANADPKDRAAALAHWTEE